MGLSKRKVSGDCGLDWQARELQAKMSQRTEPLTCPRCGSTNTKFCYYNNYNKSQPRHFCKACKRHWTEGGTLRNVPVGGYRKNKRLKSSTTTSSSSPSAGGRSIWNNSTQMSEIFSQPWIPPSAASPSQLHSIDGVNSFIKVKSFPGHNGNYFLDSTLPVLESQNPQQFTSSSSSGSLKMNPSAILEPWQVPATSNTLMDTLNYWNWDDINRLASADQLNLSWDHHKP